MNKTKYIAVNGNAKCLETEKRSIEVCNEYKCLGVTFGKEGASKRKITQRLYQSKNTIS